MRVLVNALSVSPGGAATLARGLLPALAAAQPKDQFTILVRDTGWQDGLDWPQNVSFQRVRGIGRSNALRILYEQVFVRRKLRLAQHDAYLNVAGFGVLSRGVAQVILVRNAYFFVVEPWMSLRARVRLRTQRWFQVGSWRRGAAAACVSRYMEALLDEHRRGECGPTRIIPHGLDPRFLTASRAPLDAHEARRPLRLLWVGNWRPHKNLDLFLDGVSSLRARMPQGLSVRLVGDISKQGTPMLATPRFHLDGVTFELPGYADVPALVGHYRWADVYVSTSRLESFDNCISEASATGTPIVASDIPVHREYGAGCALFFDPSNPEAMAVAVEQVVRDPRECEARCRVGRERVKDMTWEAAAVQYRELLEKVVDASRP